MTVNIPHSTSTVSVSIIDTTFRLTDTPAGFFFGPPLAGLDTFDVVAYSFLIEHEDPSGKRKRLVFDLGPAADWREALTPGNVAAIDGWIAGGAKIEVTKFVSEILEEHGVTLGANDALIWSHPHWDHMGRPSLFAKDVNLIVGPGVKAAFGNGYPANEKAPFLEVEFEGRNVEEVSFESSKLDIGGLQALDYFNDGSFYLLNAPGHCIGHIVALARVTPDSFIVMTADSFHHVGQLRPSAGVPLPKQVQLGPFTCPGDALASLYADKNAYKDSVYSKFCSSCDPGRSPFFTISQKEDGSSVAPDPEEARNVIDKLQAFDADDRVLVIAAHDATLLKVMTYLPTTANGWRKDNWKGKARWTFLKDLEKPLRLKRGEAA